MPKVSVIIPAYNHEQFIRECIDSVLSQTYRDFEVIVVDDGSADKTPQVLRTYEDRILLIEQSNKGTQAARNTAILNSSGEFIALLDSDDAWLPQKLERQVWVLESCPDVALVYSLAYIIDESGQQIGLLGHPPESTDAFSELLMGDFVPALTAIFRRSCLDEVGLFDETLLGSGDWDMWLRIAARWPIACVEEPLALYRVHSMNTTLTLSKTKRVYEEHARVIEKACTYAPDRVLPEVRRRALAPTHLYEAYLEARTGDALAAGTELGNALLCDPGLADSHSTAAMTVEWAKVLSGRNPAPLRIYRELQGIFSQAGKLAPTARRLRRKATSIYTMSKVFSDRDALDPTTLRYLLLRGILADAAWLLNLGVWSIAVEAFLGRRIARWLRRIARGLCRKSA